MNHMDTAQHNEYSPIPEAQRGEPTDLKVLYKYTSVEGGPEPISVLTGEVDVDDVFEGSTRQKLANGAYHMSGKDGQGVKERSFALLKGRQFEVILAIDPIQDQNIHLPQDSVAGAIGVYKDGDEYKEIAVAAIADGVSKVRHIDGSSSPLTGSGKVSDVSAREGVKSVMKQIAETGTYSLERMYSDIFQRLEKEGLSIKDGATTFTLVVAFNHFRYANMAKVNIHSLSKSTENGVLYTLEGGKIARNDYGNNVNFHIVPGGEAGRIANYQEGGDQALRLAKGDWMAISSDGEKAPYGMDDVSGIQIRFKG